MGVLRQFESGLADIMEIDGHQIIHLPDTFRIDARQVSLHRNGSALVLEPFPIRRRVADIEAWFRSIDQVDAGEVIPGGRNQGVTKPENLFADMED